MKMSRSDAQEHIRRQYSTLLQKARRTGFVCPCCGNGTGENGDGIKPNDQLVFHCFRCDESGDVISLLGKAEGLNYNQEFEKLRERLGLELDPDSPIERRSAPESTPSEEDEELPPKADFSELYRQSRTPEGVKKAVEYMYSRGIDEHLVRNYHMGWKDGYLIIPISNSFYIARNTEGGTPKYKNPSNAQGARVELFNYDGLYNSRNYPVFVTEGTINALSIIQAGGEAIALNSVSNWKKLVEWLKKYPVTTPFVICLDNDEAGQKTAMLLEDGLKEIGINCQIRNITGKYNDANDCLVHDPALLKRNVDLVYSEIVTPHSAIGKIDKLLNTMKGRGSKPIRTGYAELDRILDGGLFPGLYSIGAISSLGKTTFALQMADYIAGSGTDVFIFSLEMQDVELMAKSISRITFRQSWGTGRTEGAKSTRDVLNGFKDLPAEGKKAVENAIETYRDTISRRLNIVEGVGDLKIEDIKRIVKKHIATTGETPVVVIDYLQIIALSDEKATDKRNIDKAVLELKRLSRDLNIPVVAISSFNRDSYMQPVSMTNFKESGRIEYTSDVLIALQYDGMDYREGESTAAREKRIRELIKYNEEALKGVDPIALQLKVLKNRNGLKGSCLFDFFARYNTFRERRKITAAARQKTY